VPTDGDSLIFAKYAQLANPNDASAVPRVMGFRRFLGLRLRAALRAGVTVASGSDDYVDVKLPFSDLSKHTIIGYAESGVPIPKVLQFATVNASKQLNWYGQVGVLKRGAFADIIAVDADLDTNIHAIMKVHFVMKNGQVVVSRSAG
jgi:imidazolonepropionase-like amidohydrolase